MAVGASTTSDRPDALPKWSGHAGPYVQRMSARSQLRALVARVRHEPSVARFAHGLRGRDHAVIELARLRVTPDRSLDVGLDEPGLATLRRRHITLVHQRERMLDDRPRACEVRGVGEARAEVDEAHRVLR